MSAPRPPGSAAAAAPQPPPPPASPSDVRRDACAERARRVARVWAHLPPFLQLASASGCAHVRLSGALYSALLGGLGAAEAGSTRVPPPPFGCFLLGGRGGQIWALPLDHAAAAAAVPQAGGDVANQEWRDTAGLRARSGGGGSGGGSAAGGMPAAAVLLFQLEEPVIALLPGGGDGEDFPCEVSARSCGAGGAIASGGNSGERSRGVHSALLLVGARGRLVRVSAPRTAQRLGTAELQVLGSFLRMSAAPGAGSDRSAGPGPDVNEWQLPCRPVLARRAPCEALALLSHRGEVWVAALRKGGASAGCAVSERAAADATDVLHAVRVLLPGPAAAIELGSTWWRRPNTEDTTSGGLPADASTAACSAGGQEEQLGQRGEACEGAGHDVREDVLVVRLESGVVVRCHAWPQAAACSLPHGAMSPAAAAAQLARVLARCKVWRRGLRRRAARVEACAEDAAYVRGVVSGGAAMACATAELLLPPPAHGAGSTTALGAGAQLLVRVSVRVPTAHAPACHPQWQLLLRWRPDEAALPVCAAGAALLQPRRDAHACTPGALGTQRVWQRAQLPEQQVCVMLPVPHGSCSGWLQVFGWRGAAAGKPGGLAWGGRVGGGCGAAVLLTERHISSAQLRSLPRPSQPLLLQPRLRPPRLPYSLSLMWALRRSPHGAPPPSRAVLAAVEQFLLWALGAAHGCVGPVHDASAADTELFPAHSAAGMGGNTGGGVSGCGCGGDRGDASAARVLTVWRGAARVAWRAHGAAAAAACGQPEPSSATTVVELRIMAVSTQVLLSLHHSLTCAAAAATAAVAARPSLTPPGGAGGSGVRAAASTPVACEAGVARCGSLLARQQLQPAYAQLRALLTRVRTMQGDARAAARLAAELERCACTPRLPPGVGSGLAQRLQLQELTLRSSLQGAYLELLAVQGGMRAHALPLQACGAE
eukprot:278335-Chlamydomonas_euryale.AAC.18